MAGFENGEGGYEADDGDAEPAVFDGIGNPGEQVCDREALGQGIKDEMEKDLAGG